MIRPCNDADFDTLYEIINNAAQAYCGVTSRREPWYDEVTTAGLRFFWGSQLLASGCE
jgi:hypothetical protein